MFIYENLNVYLSEGIFVKIPIRSAMLVLMICLLIIGGVNASNITVSANAAKGKIWTVPSNGIYRFIITEGAVRGALPGTGVCGECASNCWSDEIFIYHERPIAWGYLATGCSKAPESPDYILGNEHYPTKAAAEKANVGKNPVNILMKEGEKLTFITHDYREDYPHARGSITIGILHVKTTTITFESKKEYGDYVFNWTVENNAGKAILVKPYVKYSICQEGLTCHHYRAAGSPKPVSVSAHSTKTISKRVKQTSGTKWCGEVNSFSWNAWVNEDKYGTKDTTVVLSKPWYCCRAA